MVVGREGDKPIYVAQLFLKPNCSLPAANPITIWFSDLLTSPGDKFNMLIQATYNLPDWAAHTKIIHYHHINKDCHKLEERISELRACLSINNKALNAC